MNGADMAVRHRRLPVMVRAGGPSTPYRAGHGKGVDGGPAATMTMATITLIDWRRSPSSSVMSQ
jgi:hypothetical protein